MQLLYHNFKKIFIATISILVVLSAIFIGFWAFNKYQEHKQYQQLHQFAEQIGLNEQNLIAEYKTCWGILGKPCGIFTTYMTHESFEEFQAKLTDLNINSYVHEVDGYTLFTNINMLTDQTITADGNDGGLKRREISKPSAKEWVFLDESGNRNRWSVTYYDIQSSIHNYELNSLKIDGNIVEVMLELK